MEDISTDRLRMRAIADRDAEDLAHVLERDRAHLAPWIPLPPAHADAVWLRARVARLVAACADGRRLTYVIREAASEELVGCVSLAPRADGAFAVSYWLAAPHCGRGFAREAVGEVCRRALADGRELVIECARANTRSGAVARTLGFVRAGRHSDGDVEVDVWRLTAARARAWHAVLAVVALCGIVRASDDGHAVRVACEGAVVEIVFAELLGEPHLIASADVCPEGRFPAHQCLAHNDALAIGALATRDDRLVLRHACRPEALTAQAIALVAREAAALAAHATHVPVAHAPFAYLAL